MAGAALQCLNIDQLLRAYLLGSRLTACHRVAAGTMSIIGDVPWGEMSVRCLDCGISSDEEGQALEWLVSMQKQ